MATLTQKLRELRAEEPDVERILQTFEEIERIYQNVLKAQGVSEEQVSEVLSTAEVTVSLEPHPSSSR